MIGVIERIKNSVLLKCSTLNDEVISKTLDDLINTRIYRFSEEMVSLIRDFKSSITEEILRNEVSKIIKTPIIKKIKRKLFIDSLALQITNDTFIEDYVNKKITLQKLEKNYIKELNKNKSSNQLNMTEDLNLEEIINKLRIYVDKNINSNLIENNFLVSSINNLVYNLKEHLEKDLKDMIDSTDLKYYDILKTELLSEIEDKKEDEGEESMMDNINETVISDLTNEEKNIPNKFDKYDDMTLFNKIILSLNTEEEKLSRKEEKLRLRKEDVDKRLSDTNKNIEANIERENKLSQRKMELNAKELEINSKLSEAEVIFLNMKPLIKGLSKIKDSNENGGSENE